MDTILPWVEKQLQMLRAAAMEAFGGEKRVEAMKALGEAAIDEPCEPAQIHHKKPKTPASKKHEELRVMPADRKWFKLLEEMAYSCPLHDIHGMGSEAQSYENEVEVCKGMVRRPNEKTCLMALKRLLAVCRDYDPVAKCCDDGWKNADLAEQHCISPFKDMLKKADAAVDNAMTCEVCGKHPDDNWDEWGCYKCGIECCRSCVSFHICGENKDDQRDIELARENAARQQDR